MSDIKTALQEFVATYNDPKVNKDLDKTLSYFPELKGFDKNALSEYIATYEDPKVKGDWEKVNSYFPEFFADNKTQKTTAPKTTAPEQNAGGFAIPMMFGNEKTIAPDPNTGIFTPEIAAGLRGEVNPNPQPTPEPTTKQWLGDLFEGMGGVASTLIGNTIDLGDRLKPENLAREIVMRSGAGKEGFKAAEEMRRSKPTADKIITDKLIGTGKQLTDKSHDYYGTVTDENGQTRPKDFTDLWSEGNYAAAFGNILLEGGKSLPTSVMAFNPVGLGVIGAGSFNEKYNDVSANKDVNMAQAVLNATGTASFELLSERLGALIDAKILKRIAKTAGAGKAKETAKAVIYEYLKAQPKEILTEGVEEAASQLAENITDIATGVKQPATMKDSFKMLFDNVLESGVYGMGGGAFGGATMGGTVAAGTMLTQPIKAKKQAESTFNDADRRLTAMLSRNGFTAEEVQDVKNSMLQANPENRNDVVLAIAQAIPEAITRKDGKVVFNPEIGNVFTDFYIGSDKLQSVNKKYSEQLQANTPEGVLAQYEKQFDKKDGYLQSVSDEYFYDKKAFIERDIENKKSDIEWANEQLQLPDEKLFDGMRITRHAYYKTKLKEANDGLLSATKALEAVTKIEQQQAIAAEKENAAQELQRLAGPDGMIRTVKLKDGTTVQVRGESMVFDENGMFDMKNSSTMLYYTDEAGQPKMMKPYLIESLVEEKPIEQAAMEADQLIDQEISDKEIDAFLPLQPEIYKDAQGTIQVQYNPETMEIEAVLLDENSGTPISDPYAIDKTTYSQMSGKTMPEAIKTTANEPLNDGSAPVVSGDMTESAPLTAESAPVQPQYPVNKKGEVDVDAMTVAQAYQYMVDNYGQQEALEALQLQEKNTQAAISANIKATDKFKSGQYAEVKKATTIQEQLKIREKHKATAQKLTDERAVLDAQLAEIRALMPVVEQAPAQPEVKPVTSSNVRPEVQFRREQEAKAKEEAENNEGVFAPVIAADYLFTGGSGVMLSSEYLLTALAGAFTKATSQIQKIRANYLAEIDAANLGNIKDFVNSDLYKKIMSEIETAINQNYGNNSDIQNIFNQILQYPTGLPTKIGNEISIKLDEINSQEPANLDSANETLTPNLGSSVIEVRSKEKKNIINPWQKRLNNLGDAMTVEDVVLRRIAGGAKFVWTANAPLKGMADELGFANKPGERELRKSMIDNENGMTPQEFAHVIFESGDLDFMPGVEYQDVYNAVLDTLLSVNSATGALEMAEQLRDSREFSMNEQAEWDSMTEAEMQYLEEIPDDILESYLGITNFTPEQLDIIQNLQNEYYGNIDTTTTETSAVDSTQGIESETATAGTTEGISTEQIQSETDLNPTEAQKKAGNYKKAHIAVSGMDISIENPVGSVRRGTDEDGKAWEHEMKSHYGYFLKTEGKDGDHIDTFIKEGIPTDWNGTVFAIDQINPKTGVFDETKVMIGYETPEEAKAAYMENYDADWKGFSAITPVSLEDFKTWLYDGKKQRKPYAEYKDTPEAVELTEQPLEKVKGITVIKEEDNGKTLVYGTKSVQTKLSVKKYTAQEIKEELDFEIKKRNDALVELQENERLLSRTPIGKDYEVLKKLISDNKKLIESTKVTIPWLEQKLKEANENISSGNKLPEQAEQQPKQVDVAGVFNSLNKKGEAKLSENIIPDKVSAAQAEADAALQDFLDAFNDLNSDKLGIVDNTAEKQAKMLVAGTKMVGAFTKLGVYKFAELVQQIQAKGIQITEDLLSAIKKAYGAFAAENDIDALDDMKTVRKFTVNDLQQKKNEDLTPKTDNSLKNDVSLNDQKSKDNGSNKPNSRTANRKPESNRGGLSLFDEVDGQRTSTENIAGNSKGEQLQSGNSSSESGIRPQYDVNKTYTNEEISEIVSSVTAIKDGKIEITGEVTEDIKTIASRYVSGGVAKKGRGILDEYYTDSKIVDAVTRIVTKLLPSNTVKRALEPSVGTGNFIQAIPTGAEIVGFEINETTARIAKIFNPNVEVNLRSFETEFIDDSGKKKPITRKYNLVVGNPPYGEHRGMYKGLGEESKISKYEDYFVKRSLDVLEEGGVLAMVLPSSWLDRHKLEAGYVIEVAYRLPSGAFEATQVGTDIVVLRKRTTNISFNPHNYFQNNPENVLGEIKERSNRFGKMEQYVAGDIDAALAKIEQNEARKVANDLQVEATPDNVNDIAESIEETGSPEKTKKVVKASKQTKTATVTTGKVEIKKGTLKYNLNKGDEVVPASAQFPNEFSPEQEAAFKDCNYSGVIPKSKYEQHKQFVNFYNFDWVHDFYYAEGNIYEKLEQLERDKPNMEQAQYDKQKQMLKSVLPEIKTLDKISISPNTEFVGNLNISNENGRINLKAYFEAFISKLPSESFGGSNSWEVRDYINNRQVYGTDKERNALVRERRKAAANDLFKKFLTDEVSAAERSQIEYAFNREYNAMYRPDYSKVPMFSSINKNFKGRPLQLTVVQRAGIGRSTVKGVGILAHEVGFGKTLSGILAVHEAMTRNTAKKPLIIVPNDGILKQWVETIYEVLPQSTVNVLGNLGVDYDLTDFTVNDNEITIVTYEGFKAMGFKDETYDKLAQDFNYITDDLKAHKSERDRQKEKAKQDETKGKMRKKVAYDFEDFGFDFMTFDEVHNANHIVGKVKLDKKVSSDFRTQNQRTSDLGIKTWLASQYIQENNNGRNVLLLSATPFTNKPLEYYSILSLVGNSTLKRMGFYQVDQFFETFMEADNDIEIKADGTPAQKTNVRRFKNNGLFNQLLSEFIDIKGEDDNPDLVRPERHNREYKIPQNDLTAETISNIQDLFINNEDVLKGITHSRLVAFSPYASSYSYATPKNYKQFVENSPKIHTALKLIAQNKKDNSGAGQLMYSEIGVEFFPMIQEYLIKEVGYNANEVRIISGATSLTERANIQNGFNKGEIKVIIGSPAIKEGINLQENTTDMYILSLPYNFTQLRQVEGRSWRQGNKWSNIRINYMLTDNSVDVFLLQRLQIKQGLYNESMKNGADTVDVSDIDTSELKTALITDPTTRANIELMIERGRLEAEKTRITSDLAFIHRKFERYNDLKKKINTEITSLQQREKWAETDPWWARNLEGARRQVETLKNEIENEKQRLIEKGVNVDDIVSQETNATNQIAEINKKIEALKERLNELIVKYTAENIAKAKIEGDVVSRYIKERAQENKGDFYTKRIVDEAPKLHTGTTMQPATNTEVADTVEQLLKTGLAKEVRMVTPEEIARILEGNEQFAVDRAGNEIGDGSWNIEETVFNFEQFPQVSASVSKSATTESTYVTYTNSDNGKSITVRFSNHENNAVRFGDQLDGNVATGDQILFHLGLKTREFIPDKYLSIWTTGVAKKNLNQYEQADKTIQELYAMGANADISEYKGKLAKGSNYLILGDTVKEVTRTKRNIFGQQVEIGTFNYKDVQFLRTPSGTIYGFVKGGIVYLNKNTPNLNTPIHEFGHLWIDAIEGTELYNRGAELVKETPYWERVNTDPNYKDLSETARTKEAMAMAIGDKGEAVVKNKGLLAKLKSWIADVWKTIGAKFGIQNLTPEQIENLTFEQFTDIAVSELLSGEKLAPQPTKWGAMPATINVDGIQRPTTNSNGKPIHSTEEGIRNFWRWFGDSKVVDNEGRPLAVYHGTPEGGFNSFSYDTKGKRTNHSPKDVGFHFTDDKDYASSYSLEYRKIAYPILMETLGYIPDASKAPEKAMTYEVYLSLKNPMIFGYANAIDESVLNKAIENGHDGIIGKIGETTEYVVFYPTQIKSATGNFGSFDPSNADIRYQIIGERGARNLDAAEEATTRLDNLAIAKEMEKGKEDRLVKKLLIAQNYSDAAKQVDMYPDDLHYKQINKIFDKYDDIRKIKYDLYWEKSKYIIDAAKEAGKQGVEVFLSEDDKGNDVIYFEMPFGQISFHIQGENWINKLPKSVKIENHKWNGEKNTGVLLRDNLIKQYSPLEIRLATGWERGVDGLWRYEVPDGNFKNIKYSLSEIPNDEAKLSDIWDDDKLFTSYPQLKDITVKINNNTGYGGSYIKETNTIEINLLKSVGKEGQKSTLIHEIQHAIQEIEGFAQGGMPEKISSEQKAETLSKIEKLEEETSKYENSEEGAKMLDDKKTLEDKYLNNEMTALEYQNAIAEFGIKYPFYNGYKHDSETIAKLYRSLDSVGTYRRLAGEVEARNASARMNMSEEERRQTLLSATADVAPEDQIILMDATGVSMSIPEKPQPPVFSGREDVLTRLKQSSEYAKELQKWQKKNIENIAAQVSESEEVNKKLTELNKSVDKWSAKLWEGWADGQKPVKKWQNFLKANGVEINDANDYYMRFTMMPGRVEYRFAEFDNTYLKPFIEILKAFKDRGVDYDALGTYAKLKHADEYTEHIANQKNVKIDADTDFAGKRAIEERLGMSAEQYIADIESIGKANGLTDMFWKQVKRINEFSLMEEVRSGRRTAASAEQILSTFEWYVPLKNHYDMTAEDTFDYSTERGQFFVTAVKRGKGRRSESGDPFSVMVSTVRSSIGASEENMLKQALHRLAELDPTGSTTVSKAWFKKTGEDADGKHIFEVAPTVEWSNDDTQETYNEKVRAFEMEMQDLAAKGEAYRGKIPKLKIGVWIKPTNAGEHEVHVMRNGEMYVVRFNTSPRVPQAVNKVNYRYYEGFTGAIFENTAKLTRFMAATKTMFRPTFIFITNPLRDIHHGVNLAYINRGAKFTAQAVAFLPIAATTLMRRAAGKINVNNKYDMALNNYMLYGAKTGISKILELKQMERSLKSRMTNKPHLWSRFKNVYQAVSEITENQMRFAVYLAALKNGDSTLKAVSMAKQATVNFDLKGNGRNGLREISSLYAFVRVGFQAIDGLYSASTQSAETKRRFAGAVTMNILGGMVLTGAISSLIYNLFKGDDDDEDGWINDFAKLSTYERNSNFLIWTPDGVAKYPLGQEFRVFHGLGMDMLMLMHGKATATETAINFGAGITSLLPYNPIESAVQGSWGSAMPDVVSPWAELAANRDWMGTRIYKENQDEDAPGYMKVRTNKRGEYYASEFMYRLSKALDKATGGDEAVKGWFSPNPDVAEHLVGGYLNGLLAQTLTVADGIINKDPKEFIPSAIWKSNDDIRQRTGGLNEVYFEVKEATEETKRRVSIYEKSKDELKQEFEKGLIDPGTYNSSLKRINNSLNALDKSEYYTHKGVLSTISELEAQLKANKGDKQAQQRIETSINELKEYLAGGDTLKGYYGTRAKYIAKREAADDYRKFLKKQAEQNIQVEPDEARYTDVIMIFEGPKGKKSFNSILEDIDKELEKNPDNEELKQQAIEIMNTIINP